MLECRSEPMNFPLSVGPSKKMGDRARQRKKSPFPRRESNPRPQDLIVRCSTEL